MAVCAVSIGAIAAVFFMADKENLTATQSNAYVEQQKMPDRVIDKVEDNTNSFVLDPALIDETETANKGEEASKAKDALSQQADAKQEKEVVTTDMDSNVATETFNSTTATKAEPFFADGDTFLSPVADLAITVPYTDETTAHWFSESLDQTIRTNGVCIAAKEGEAILAGAEGTVIEVSEDSTELDEALLPGNLGHIVKIDHGNGYVSVYGIQKGSIAEGLKVGSLVKAGQAIGTVGKGTGPFVLVGSNVYIQVTKNNTLLNPEDLLEGAQSVAMGHDVD